MSTARNRPRQHRPASRWPVPGSSRHRSRWCCHRAASPRTPPRRRTRRNSGCPAIAPFRADPHLASLRRARSAAARLRRWDRRKCSPSLAPPRRRLQRGVVVQRRSDPCGASLPPPWNCGGEGNRTPGLFDATEALYQLSYTPEAGGRRIYLRGCDYSFAWRRRAYEFASRRRVYEFAWRRRAYEFASRRRAYEFAWRRIILTVDAVAGSRSGR